MNESVRLITKDSKKKSSQTFAKESSVEIDALQDKVEKQIEKTNKTYNDFELLMDEHQKYAKCCDFYKVFVGSVEIAKEV